MNDNNSVHCLRMFRRSEGGEGDGVTTGLQAFHDGDFDQAMAEAGPATKENINDAMGAYIAMFHESFFILDGPSISVSKEELYRWLDWCVFYGRPRDEYPDAEKD